MNDAILVIMSKLSEPDMENFAKLWKHCEPSSGSLYYLNFPEDLYDLLENKRIDLNGNIVSKKNSIEIKVAKKRFEIVKGHLKKLEDVGLISDFKQYPKRMMFIKFLLLDAVDGEAYE